MAWDLTGNAGTNDIVDFVGTTDTQDLVLKADGNEMLRLKQDTGTVNVGTNADTGLYPILAVSAQAPYVMQTLRSQTDASPIITAMSHGKTITGDTSVMALDLMDLDDGDVAVYECTVTVICVTAGNGVAVGDTLARKMSATCHRTGSNITIDHQQTDLNYTAASLSAVIVSIDASFGQLQLNIQAIDTAILSCVSESKWTKHGA